MRGLISKKVGLSLLLSFLIYTSCGDKPRNDANKKPVPPRGQTQIHLAPDDVCKNIAIPSGDPRWLAFTAMEGVTGTGAWKGQFVVVDPNHAKIYPLLLGQSSDAIVKKVSANTLILLNRTQTQKSMRVIQFKPMPQHLQGTAPQLDIGPETMLPGGQKGDPHDVVALGPDHLLFAHFMQGNLTLYNYKTQKQTVIHGPWSGISASESLHPEALVLNCHQGQLRVYVVHQPYNIQRGRLLSNSSSKIYPFTWQQGELRPLNVGADGKTIQGIDLYGTFAVPAQGSAQPLRESHMTLVSMCSRYVEGPCKSTVERFDFHSQGVVRVANPFFLKDLLMNGPVILGADQNHVLVHVEKKSGENSYTGEIHSWGIADFAHPTTEVSWTSPASDAGSHWPSIYHQKKKQLWVSRLDKNSGKGSWTVLEGKNAVKTIPLGPFAPYNNAVWVE